MTAEIFTHCLPKYPLRSIPSESAMLLGQVCRQWREISISSPRIWQSLQLELTPKIHPQQVRLLRSWLRRSGTLPLSISITHKAIETVPAVSCASEIIEEVILHCSRWQYMEIEIPFDDLKSIQGAMPCLRHLTIGPTAVPESPPSHPLQLFGLCPQLQHIVLSQYFQPSTVQLCWERVTHVKGLFLYPEECVEILRQTVNISHFEATIESSDADLTPVPILLKLESLVFLPGSTEPDDSQMRLLHALTLPSLRILRISEPWFLQNPWASIAELVARSCCIITDLFLTESADWWNHLNSLQLASQNFKSIQWCSK
ncbi:hypothetical protein B0H14DRAFT_2504093 [Mycena olivaceomarginata]|nr:hypothetical protein B0H14DRAFT_2504093 [Mycena olivaceomarginata]